MGAVRLDRVALQPLPSRQMASSPHLQSIDWDTGDVTVLNLTGRITLGGGTGVLRESIREVLDRGRKKILLNMDEVVYVDSSGLGELVSSYIMVQKAGGTLKLMKLKQLARDLIQFTKMHMVFEVYADEASAIESFKNPDKPK
jgi:anti-sigma B factor antagonist